MRRRAILWGIPAALTTLWLERKLVQAEDAAKKGAAIPRRKLGRTGEQVSCIGLGGAHVGMQKDPDESVRIIRRALDAGSNFLDNCWDYNEGQSEIRMGRALRDGYRDKAFLMSKIDGRTRSSAAEQIDESLRRLQTDRIDLMQIHEIIRMNDPERVFADGGTLEALIAAQKAGKLRFIGFTGHKSAAIHLHMLDVAAAHGFRFDTVQMPLNVMDAHDPEGFERRVLPRLLEQQIGVLGMKPLGGGKILASGKVSAVDCLQYALSLPTSVVITGCDSMNILEQALKTARGQPLTPSDRTSLLARTAKTPTPTYELYKSSTHFDGTTHHPDWLG